MNLIRIYKFHFESHMFDIFMQMWQNRKRRTSGLCTWNPWDWLQNWLKVKFISLYSMNNTSYSCIEVHFSFSICSHQFVYLNAGNDPRVKRALLTTRTILFCFILTLRNVNTVWICSYLSFLILILRWISLCESNISREILRIRHFKVNTYLY